MASRVLQWLVVAEKRDEHLSVFLTYAAYFSMDPGMNSYDLGWYQDRTLTLNPLTDGAKQTHLATFVDYDLTTNNEPVLVSIAYDAFLFYNRAKGFNVDTEEKQNRVTITVYDKVNQGTSVLAALDVGESFELADFQGSGKSLFVTVCKRVNAVGTSPDIMVISIAMESSDCTEPSTATVKPSSSTGFARGEITFFDDIPVAPPAASSPSIVPSPMPVPLAAPQCVDDPKASFLIGNRTEHCSLLENLKESRALFCKPGKDPYTQCRASCNNC
jgi:hypothetical protein